MRKERIWITWERHRRTRELVGEVGAELFEVISAAGGAARYLWCLTETLRLLMVHRPRILFVQSPSYVLAFMAGVLRPLFRYKLVIDAHNGVTYRLAGAPSLLRNLISASVARSDLVIVTSAAVCPTIEAHGGRPVILPDKMPSITAGELCGPMASRPRPWLTLIASYQHDEPIESILTGALEVWSKGTLFVTGRRPADAGLDRFASEPRIEFTGFLEESDYEALIGTSDLLIDISSEATVLVCGGYEAMSVGVPAVVSDSPVSRDVFRPGFVYAENSAPGYRRAIESFLEDSEGLRAEIRECRQSFPARWKAWFAGVEAAVDRLES